MKTASLVILLSFFYIVNVVAQEYYPVNTIAAHLLKDASVVVRLQEKNIQIKDEGSALVKVKYVYTILNAGGDDYADFAQSYDKLMKPGNIDGTLYNAEGIRIKTLKKNELKDYSNTSEATLADDDRVKVHNFNHRIYPYTISYESTIEMDGLFYLPSWIPVFDEKIAIEKSLLKVEIPIGYKLRYKSFNIAAAPGITRLKNTEVYSWKLEAFPALIQESYSPAWYEITPSVFLAPSDFRMQKFDGSMNTWAEFGAFYYKLNSNRDILPDQIKRMVHQLTDHVKTPGEKVDVLYKYLQKNTRYISIQFGIGGWQTLDAAFVSANGYGDCKALTNYMYALLKEAGIKSFCALVKAGRSSHSFLNDFASNQFNHIILCVPLQKDSVWLECTSQSLPTGYLSSFTSNRPVLLIDENGGMLGKTPAYTSGDNLQVRHITAGLDADGLLIATATTTYRAEQQDELHGILSAYSKEKIADHVKTKFDLPNYEVQQFTHLETYNKLPIITEQVNFTAKNFASVSGKRLFISPNVLSVSNSRIRNAETRKYDIDLNFAFTDYDTVQINIPDGYSPESIPPNVSIEMPLARYQSSLKIESGKIFYTRHYQQRVGRLPAVTAQTMATFFEKIYKADHAKIVFVKEANL